MINNSFSIVTLQELRHRIVQLTCIQNESPFLSEKDAETLDFLIGELWRLQNLNDDGDPQS